MNFKIEDKTGYRITAQKKGSVLEVHIFGRISPWNDVNAEALWQRFVRMDKSGFTQTRVYLNSEGGSCFEATELCNVLSELPGVKVYVGALAASAATYILAHFPSKAKRNSQIMIHRPMLFIEGNSAQIKAQLKLLENTETDYLRVYAEKTNKTPAEIEALWDKGDYWMNATQAKAFGIIDEIEDTEAEITQAIKKQLVACSAPNLYESNIKSTMDKETKTQTEAVSSDAQTQGSVTLSVEQLEAFKQQTKLLEETQKKLEAMQENTVIQLIDKAILEKRITADQKEDYKALAKTDLEAVKRLLQAKAPVEKVSDKLNTDASTPSQTRANWTFEDWRAKAPKGFEVLLKENPEQAESLVDAYINQ